MYLVIDGNNFGFDTKEGIPITYEDYKKFFELESQGKQFRIKNKLGTTLFEILEEYTPVFENTDTGATLEERVDNLEKENADLTFALMEAGVI